MAGHEKPEETRTHELTRPDWQDREDPGSSGENEDSADDDEDDKKKDI